MPPVASPHAARVRDLLESLNQELDPELGARIGRADRPRDDGGGLGSGGDRINGNAAPLASGIGAIDALLGGGFPRGALSEISGPASSGRTSLGLALLARLTRRGDYVAWIDAADAFDPLSAEAAGVVLERVLWVRAPDALAALRCSERVLETEGFGFVGLDLSASGGPQHARPALSRRGGPRGGRRTRSVAVPDAAWLRLTRRVAGKDLALLVLSDKRMAGSRAAAALELAPAKVRFTGTPRLLEPMEPVVDWARPFRAAPRVIRRRDEEREVKPDVKPGMKLVSVRPEAPSENHEDADACAEGAAHDRAS